MKTNNLLIEKEVGKAKMGYLTDSKKSVKNIQLNQLVPYLPKKEDFEIVFRNNSLLEKSQPLEFNGFNTIQFLEQANILRGELLEQYTTYSELTTNHPSIMSFPAEVVWLSNGLENFKTNIIWGLQKGEIGFNKEKAVKIAGKYEEIIKNNQESYGFWETIPQKFESEILSRRLIDLTIELSRQAKMKYLAGLVPIIDSKAIGSIALSHTWNLSYATVIDDWRDNGLDVPKYFYTINLNSSIIEKDNWTEALETLIRYADYAIRSQSFDGIHLTIRGLSRISGDSGKVATLLKLISELIAIAHNEGIPFWLSRFGIIGLGLLDEGVDFASFSLNMGIDDVFSKFNNSGRQNKEQLYGKIFHRDMKKILDLHQIMKLPNGLPEVKGFKNKPTDLELSSSTAYRKGFAKPYNLAGMNHLNGQWFENIKNGETNPGREYLQKFDSPRYFSTWGIS